ncbi:heat shock protein beta-9 [Megalops cyprinoides]|uniref:heat shock protein beta-9 n=1 Tax=Megalops cyprinoides TaxID=118141 RepID=UPI001865683A|nr:heat shock protein beta-9 [Megalops cyprinoides]
MQSTVTESLFAGDPFFEGTRVLWPLRRGVLADMREDFFQRRSAMVDSFLREFRDAFPYDFLKGAALPSSRGPLGALTNGEAHKPGMELSLDVREFSPEDITVKLAGRQLAVVATKQAEGGEARCSGFVQKIDLPEHVNLTALTCSLTADGLLKIEAPATAHSSEERTVPIRFRTSLNVPISNSKKEEDKSQAT